MRRRPVARNLNTRTVGKVATPNLIVKQEPREQSLLRSTVMVNRRQAARSPVKSPSPIRQTRFSNRQKDFQGNASKPRSVNIPTISDQQGEIIFTPVASRSSRDRTESITSTGTIDERLPRKRRKPASFGDYIDHSELSSRKHRKSESQQPKIKLEEYADVMENESEAYIDLQKHDDRHSGGVDRRPRQVSFRVDDVGIDEVEIFAADDVIVTYDDFFGNDIDIGSIEQPIVKEIEISEAKQVHKMVVAKSQENEIIDIVEAKRPASKNSLGQKIAQMPDRRRGIETISKSQGLPAPSSNSFPHASNASRYRDRPMERLINPTPPPKAAPLLVAGSRPTQQKSRPKPPILNPPHFPKRSAREPPSIVGQHARAYSFIESSHMPRNTTTVNDRTMMFEYNGKMLMLEPLVVAEADDTSRETLGMYDQLGNLVGIGNINEHGEFMQEMDLSTEHASRFGGENEFLPIAMPRQEQSMPVGTIQHAPQAVIDEKLNAARSPSPLDDGDDDGPPCLEPEVAEVEPPPNPPPAESVFEEFADGLVDDDLVDDDAALEYGEADTAHANEDIRSLEFSVVDNNNICCGLCGDIVPYDLILSDHLPNAHPEIEHAEDVEEISYESWVRTRMSLHKHSIDNTFRATNFFSAYGGIPRNTRRVSQVRVCPAEMTMEQLDECLKRKMVEKLGRRVNVSLVDKLHARCGECGSILSLNKKFEIMHLVRHFNAWHPTTHRCAGTWANRHPQPGLGKPLTSQDFAVVDNTNSPDSMQCIWCGMFISKISLAMHFHECHADEIEVPSCRLCIEELIINARLHELYMEDFDVIMPDEKHYECGKFGIKTKSEERLFKLINKRFNGEDDYDEDDEDDLDSEPIENGIPGKPLQNSRMHYGRRNRPKRTFVMPAYRQKAPPKDSAFIEALSDTQWRCKLCDHVIMAAVMSAGCINHYKKCHPVEHEELRYELCKTRLEYISDGCMEFINHSLIECLMCHSSFALHRPYNMCRAIRHLQKKHPEMMPETQHNAPVGYSRNVISLGSQNEPLRQANDKGKDIKIESNLAAVEDASEASADTLPEDLLDRVREVTDIEFEEIRVITNANNEALIQLFNKNQLVDEFPLTSVVDPETLNYEAEAPPTQIQHEQQYVYEEGLLVQTEEDMAKHLDLPPEEYCSDEGAPDVADESTFFRRLYDSRRYEEMQSRNQLRAEPEGMERKVMQLDEEFGFKIMEYFTFFPPSSADIEMIK